MAAKHTKPAAPQETIQTPAPDTANLLGWLRWLAKESDSTTFTLLTAKFFYNHDHIISDQVRLSRRSFLVNNNSSINDLLEKDLPDDLYYKVVKEVDKRQAALRSVPGLQHEGEEDQNNLESELQKLTQQIQKIAAEFPDFDMQRFLAQAVEPTLDETSSPTEKGSPPREQDRTETASTTQQTAEAGVVPQEDVRSPQEFTVYTASKERGRYKNPNSQRAAEWAKDNRQRHLENNLRWEKTEKGRQYKREYMRRKRAQQRAERLPQQQTPPHSTH
jgi:hypothetical protein